MPKLNNQRATRIASFKRIARHLRVRSRNYARLAKHALRAMNNPEHDRLMFRSGIVKELAEEFENEAATLRALK